MKAFLSHSSDDDTIAKRIFWALRNQGIPVWFDHIELRPGDSLLNKIRDGIATSDILVVLISPSSVYSDWVQLEIKAAMSSKKIRIIPLVFNCEIPDVLSDLKYIKVSETDFKLHEILSAIFSDSFILNVKLENMTLELNKNLLVNELCEFIRSNYGKLILYIDNCNFDSKIDHIVRASETMGYIAPMMKQIRDNSELFSLHLPIYWSNLSSLMGHLATEVFKTGGKNIQSVSLAAEAMTNTFRYCQLLLAEDLALAIFEDAARKAGFEDIAFFIRKYSVYFDYPLPGNGDKLEKEMLEVDAGESLSKLELDLKTPDNPQSTRIFWHVSESRAMELRGYSIPSKFFGIYDWYVHVMPQLLRNFLRMSIYKEGKPLAELPYEFEYDVHKYRLVGFA